MQLICVLYGILFLGILLLPILNNIVRNKLKRYIHNREYEFILSFFTKVRSNTIDDIDDYFCKYGGTFRGRRGYPSNRTVYVACELDKIDYVSKIEILSEVYQRFKKAGYVDIEYGCDMAETITKMTEIILDKYIGSDIDHFIITDCELECLAQIGNTHTVLTQNTTWRTFTFNHKTIAPIKKYNLQTEINKDLRRIKSSRTSVVCTD